MGTQSLVSIQIVTLHEKTKHNALDINLRYRPKQLPKLIIIIFHFLTQIDRGIIPLHKDLLCSFQNAILTELWLEVRRVATQSVHDTEPLRLDKHGSCTQKCLQPVLSSILCINEVQKRLSSRSFPSKRWLLLSFERFGSHLAN